MNESQNAYIAIVANLVPTVVNIIKQTHSQEDTLCLWNDHCQMINRSLKRFFTYSLWYRENDETRERHYFVNINTCNQVRVLFQYGTLLLIKIHCDNNMGK